MGIRKKQLGQSLTEFALITPLLMFVFMVIIDFSRVLLTYTQTSAAVRNALRYGVIIGLDEGSQNYLDCAGIQAAASQALFSDIDSITVEYETPISNPTNYNNGVTLDCASATDNNIENGDILVVNVESDVSFITPFVPFESLPVDIEGRRTLVKQVEIDTVSSPSDTDNVPLIAITAPDPTPDTFWTDVATNTIYFTGYASDTEDGDLSANINWFLDGSATVAGTGASFNTTFSMVGSHQVQAEVMDSDGHKRTTSLDVEIVAFGSNTAPVLTVDPNRPTSTPYAYNLGNTISFEASADDAEDEPGVEISDSIVWYVDGVYLGTGGGPFTMVAGTDLSTGSHTVFVTVQDSGGLRDQTFRTISVIDPSNNPPDVFIDAPAGSSVYDISETITFVGHATDDIDDDATLTDSIRWETNTGTILGTGPTIDVDASDLGPGVHTIWARVADSGSATNSASVNVEVTATYDLVLATLNIYVLSEEGGSYEVRRLAGDWTGNGSDTDETAVTWNNFSAIIDSTAQSSFSTTSSSRWRYKAVEVTQLVTDWYNNTYANDGLVIHATSNNDLMGIASREWGYGTRPSYIQVYLSDGTHTFTCDKVNAAADTYIKSAAQWANYGGATVIYSHTGSYDKELLIRFDQTALNAAIAGCGP